ncbi:uncharacterized protein At1g01500 isoform X1 [Selaginella moellendorffii]|uniref:uncharacterized protein At1g01500 isoform X1 n=1 Tax=Selaginella moellendorffii TaxID=88036 RepID=UPI000D1C6388|nr:uncharacterized protein At1g01500 isoform X1 [Selaginella moellendorffii]|eukprot:XP_024529149.1 uncharacterized protein At1g01500 isoform X1 [Selaginella moellendorffii]
MGQQDLRRNRAQQQRNQTTLLHGRSRSGGGRGGGGSGSGNGGRFSVCSSWFDVRVLYARVAFCAVEEAPELLTIWFPPRGIDIALEVNGGRVAPSEEACIALRRDRLDLESEEVTFVSTDNLRTSGSLAFEIYHRHDFLVSGCLKQSVISSHDSSSFCEGGMPGIRKLGWRMECSCEAGSSKCSFVRVQQHHLRSPPPPPSPSPSSSSSSSSSLTTLMEVCVVGRYIGSPVILTQTVQLNARRSRLRCTVLDVIPEDEECCGAATPTPKNRCFGSGGGGGGGVPRECFVTDQQQQQLGENFPEAAEVSVSAVKSRDGDDGVDRDDDDDEEFRKLYESDYEENGDVSWFNAGVRVGVGIGLGMCLGVGLGVGLMVRTYNATARSFRRGLL